MSTILTDSKHYADIAAAIRSKNETNNKYKPSEMAAAIDAIEGTKYEEYLGEITGFGTLENTSWADIKTIAASGGAENYWAVGDTKSVYFKGTVGTLAIDATYYAYILGFDHNAEIEGTGITFGCFKTQSGVDIALCDSLHGSTATNGTKYFNMYHSAGSNAGGWGNCDLRYDILGSTQAKGTDATSEAVTNPVPNTFMAALPDDLRAVIKPTTIYTNNVGGSGDTASKVTATIDYLYLLSEFEVFGVRASANSAEQNYQKQYDYFKAGNSKLKYRHDTNAVSGWWTRSSDTGIYSFCGIDTGGKIVGYGAHASYNIAPIFRVG